MKHPIIGVLISIVVLTSSCNLEQKNEEMINSEVSENGIITKLSNQDFESTYSKLRSIIEKNPNLKILMELDHQKNAESVGDQLNPTRIILFGNPKLGTPLMKNVQAVSLDLPQKIVVYKDINGLVKVSYNDPAYLRDRHNIDGVDEILRKIGGALDKITNEAISE